MVNNGGSGISVPKLVFGIILGVLAIAFIVIGCVGCST